MSAAHSKSSSLPPGWIKRSPQITSTGQLWQRNMPDGIQGDHVVLNRSQVQDPAADGHHHYVAAGSGRRTSSSVSSRSQRRSPSPSRAGSKTPLTPEESPPFSRTTRKRNAGIVEGEDKEFEGASPAHTRQSSGDSGIHVCICQPDPKIPRPRNGKW